MAEIEGFDEVLDSMPEPERARFRSWWQGVPSAWVQEVARGYSWQALIAKAWAVRAALQPVNRTLVQDTLKQERKRFEPLLRALREKAQRHDEGWGDSVDAAAYDLWQLVPSDLRIDAGKEGDDGAAR
jgi:hypothetical protein